MLRLRVMATFAGLLALAVCLGACIPDDRRGDDQKDPHFQRGIKLVNSQDFNGAVDEFEKALEDHPHSPAAHFELGCLYDKLGDNAAAIYHYEQHLKWLSNSDQAALVNERIRGCRQMLADTEFSPPVTQELQRKVDRLIAENLALRQQAAAWQRAAERPPPSFRSEARPPIGTERPAPLRLLANTRPATVAPGTARPRVHIVKQRETVSSIAMEYGLRASAVLAANPRVDPRRLRIGQSLALP